MRGLILSLSFISILMIAALSFAGLSGSLEENAVIQRIKPLGTLTIEGIKAEDENTKKETVADIGQSRYEQTCKMCHETGLAGAPKFGNKSDWQPRIAEGMDTVFNRALHGYKAMPPKGGCSNCSDEEIKKAVEYMVSHSK